MDADRDAQKEPAEGSRETVDEALQQQDEDRSRPGITNRPVAEEEREQAQLPPRGEKKRESA